MKPSNYRYGRAEDAVEAMLYAGIFATLLVGALGGLVAARLWGPK